MKKYLKFIFTIIGIVAVAFVLDRAVGFVVEKWMLPKYENKYIYAYHGGQDEEVVIFGASRASHHYVSSVIEDSLGVKAYNYGCDGQNIYNQYAIFNMLLNNCRKKPKVVLLEMAYIDVLNTPTWNTEKLNNLFPYYSYDDSVKSVIGLKENVYQYAIKASTLYRYNSEVHDYVRTLVGIHNNIVGIHGYVPLYSEWKKPMESTTDDNKQIDNQKIEYLKRFIMVCKRNDISLIILNSPDFKDYGGEQFWIKTAREIANSEGVPFYNFGSDERFLAHPEWFNEPFHLNDTGAKEYTKMIIPIIRERIGE